MTERYGQEQAPKTQPPERPERAPATPPPPSGYPDRAPDWAHRLLDAFLTGEPLNFGRSTPPSDIRDRLSRAVADGTLGKSPL